ncbi:four helix bundle protein [Maribellus comscasis]|uniref:Four helix bundle protein n=1 Tax=Maribellus comscasis TaxID=2681766 RepID=A0A6I6JQA7_9BACT|nr:four helix bundle protein [Maribellus comscasis]QGY44591.1 four helix bundle protein [Maribellus comscasis]
MHNFRNLKIWQKSRILVKEVFLLTRDFPAEEKFVLTSQILRSAYSIPSNIAEGSGRSSNKEFVRFLDIALSSAFELETQLILASDIGYLSENKLEKILTILQEIQKMIYSFKTSL